MPIYNGCPHYDRYFRKAGVILWGIHTLDKILKFIESDEPNRLYNNFDNFEDIKFNYDRVYSEFWTNEDWLYENYFKHWL